MVKSAIENGQIALFSVCQYWWWSVHFQAMNDAGFAGRTSIENVSETARNHPSKQVENRACFECKMSEKSCRASVKRYNKSSSKEAENTPCKPVFQSPLSARIPKGVRL